MRDLEDVKAKDERKAVFNAIDKLRQLGPRLTPPHIKALAGETDLFELRPKQGSSKTRPIVVRQAAGYLVIAVAADHAKDMDTAIRAARERLASRAH